MNLYVNLVQTLHRIIRSPIIFSSRCKFVTQSTKLYIIILILTVYSPLWASAASLVYKYLSYSKYLHLATGTSPAILSGKGFDTEIWVLTELLQGLAELAVGWACRSLPIRPPEGLTRGKTPPPHSQHSMPGELRGVIALCGAEIRILGRHWYHLCNCLSIPTNWVTGCCNVAAEKTHLHNLASGKNKWSSNQKAPASLCLLRLM